MTNTKEISLDELWRSVSIDDLIFNPELLTNLPDLAHRYLESAIAPGTQLVSAVRLWLHGEIKLGKKWHPFKGEEVICWNRGMGKLHIARRTCQTHPDGWRTRDIGELQIRSLGQPRR
jgi:hypothetical protein